MFINLDAVHTDNTDNTRSPTSKNLFCEFSIQERSFLRVEVNIWNKIPEDLRKLSKSCFKNKLKTILLNNLKLNGYHVEISKLIFN